MFPSYENWVARICLKTKGLFFNQSVHSELNYVFTVSLPPEQNWLFWWIIHICVIATVSGVRNVQGRDIHIIHFVKAQFLPTTLYKKYMFFLPPPTVQKVLQNMFAKTIGLHLACFQSSRMWNRCHLPPLLQRVNTGLV